MEKIMNFLRALWRPLFAYVYITFFAAICVVTIIMLWRGFTTFTEVQALLITLVGAGSGVTGSYVVGRTFEKRHSPPEGAPPPEFQEGN